MTREDRAKLRALAAPRRRHGERVALPRSQVVALLDYADDLESKLAEARRELWDASVLLEKVADDIPEVSARVTARTVWRRLFPDGQMPPGVQE